MKLKTPAVILSVQVRNTAPVMALAPQHLLDTITGRFFYFISATLPLISLECRARLGHYTATIATQRQSTKHQPNNRHTYQQFTISLLLKFDPFTNTISFTLRRLPQATTTDQLRMLTKACTTALGYALHSMRMTNKLPAYSSSPVVPFDVCHAYAPICLTPKPGTGIGLGAVPSLLYQHPTQSPYPVRDERARVTYWSMSHPLTGAMLYDDHISCLASAGAPRPTTTWDSFGLDPVLVHLTEVYDVTQPHMQRCVLARVPVRPKHWRDTLEAALVEELR